MNIFAYFFQLDTPMDTPMDIPMDVHNNLPLTLQKDINLITNKFAKSQNILTSLTYLLRDIFYSFLVLFVTFMLQPYLDSSVLFACYSLAMGTVWTGLWVLGHECGHGAFGRTKLQNDILGFIIHSALLVPYFSWKYSHNKHHKYTNHLILGETHVPPTKKGFKSFAKIQLIIGDDAFSIFNVFVHLLFGWPAYLFNNDTGGRTQSDLKTKLNKRCKDHFHSSSQVMKQSLGWTVELSTLGCLTTIFCIFKCLGSSAFFWYFGPYLVTNSWLVLYTWLQHTHIRVPHYGSNEFSFLRGALSTIDRPYPWLIDHLHHNIGTTHVAHHLDYKIPHYHAPQVTIKLKALLGELYLYDSSPIYKALFSTASQCHYVQNLDGVQYYHCK